MERSNRSRKSNGNTTPPPLRPRPSRGLLGLVLLWRAPLILLLLRGGALLLDVGQPPRGYARNAGIPDDLPRPLCGLLSLLPEGPKVGAQVGIILCTVGWDAGFVRGVGMESDNRRKTTPNALQVTRRREGHNPPRRAPLVLVMLVTMLVHSQVHTHTHAHMRAR